MNKARLISILTDSTCGSACWEAHEEACRCSCGGRNHGILRRGGDRPQRTAKIDGNLYDLAAVISQNNCECYAHFSRECANEVRRIEDERFPLLDLNAYGDYRPEKTRPVLDRKISATQEKWPEVQAVKGAARLIWSRPVGSPYQQHKT